MPGRRRLAVRALAGGVALVHVASDGAAHGGHATTCVAFVWVGSAVPAHSGRLGVPDPGLPASGGPAPTDPVERLIYASASRVRVSVFDEMRRIREQALRNNVPQGLRVVLLFMSGFFVEWVEGPGPAIDALLKRVTSDERHHSVTVLHRSVGPRRLQRPWIGAIVQSREPARAVVLRIQDWRQRYLAGERHEPAHVWMGVSAPPAPDMPARGEAVQRVMLLSARGAIAFDLLQWLAESRGRQLVRRRFAARAEDVPDVASDYLDLPDLGPGGVRLLANARRGLAMGVLHAFMPANQVIVLLLDRDKAVNAHLVERVLGVCDETAHHPPIVGVGDAGTVADGTLARRVQAAGHAWSGLVVPREHPTMADLWGVLAPGLEGLLRR
jgi:hypothetical protein